MRVCVFCKHYQPLNPIKLSELFLFKCLLIKLFRQTNTIILGVPKVTLSNKTLFIIVLLMLHCEKCTQVDGKHFEQLL